MSNFRRCISFSTFIHLAFQRPDANKNITKMKKITLLLLSLLLYAGLTQAQTLSSSKWKTNISLDYLFVETKAPINCEVLASYGTQLNDHLFVGVGTGYGTSGRHGDWIIPIFIHNRVTIGPWPMAPFVDCKVGLQRMNKPLDLYLKSSVGLEWQNWSVGASMIVINKTISQSALKIWGASFGYSF